MPFIENGYSYKRDPLTGKLVATKINTLPSQPTQKSGFVEDGYSYKRDISGKLIATKVNTPKSSSPIPNKSSGGLNYTFKKDPLTGRLKATRVSDTLADEENKEKKTPWQWVSKQLQKPGGATAELFQGLGYGIGTGLKGGSGMDVLKEFGKGGLEAGKVLIGQKETSFSEKLAANKRNIQEAYRKDHNQKLARLVLV